MSVSVAPAKAPRVSRDWSDIVGFLSCIGLATFSVLRSPDVVLLLAPVLLYELALALSFLTRGRPLRVNTGWGQRIAAYGGSYMMPVALPLVSELQPQWIAPTDVPALLTAGVVVRAVGFVLCAWGLWHLRRSFSVIPAARALVTGGAYAFFRHPLYVGYAATFLGGLLQRPTPVYATLVAVWLWLTYRRIQYEEAVLEAAFPEYAEYRHRVGLLAPHFHRTRSRTA